MIKKVITTFLFTLISFTTLFSQNRPKTILWEITGKGMPYKSYLLGTNHGFNDTWIDSFTLIKEKLFNATTIVTELPIHSQADLNKSKVDTNHIQFNKLFSLEEYKLVDDYLKRKGLSGMENAPNNFYSVLGLFHATYGRLMQPKEKENSDAIDVFIEKVGKEKNSITYLDSGTNKPKTDSVPILNEKVLAGLIVWAINNENNTNAINTLLNTVNPFLDEFRELTVDYKLKENLPDPNAQATRELLLKRNEAWLTKLPTLLKGGACFIAVGLEHLKYKEGLVSRLRAVGFTVKPVPIKRKHSS
jgi:uncharacterized protein YbaP (TraB family)